MTDLTNPNCRSRFPTQRPARCKPHPGDREPEHQPHQCGGAYCAPNLLKTADALSPADLATPDQQQATAHVARRSSRPQNARTPSLAAVDRSGTTNASRQCALANGVGEAAPNAADRQGQPAMGRSASMAPFRQIKRYDTRGAGTCPAAPQLEYHQRRTGMERSASITRPLLTFTLPGARPSGEGRPSSRSSHSALHLPRCVSGKQEYRARRLLRRSGTGS